MARIVLPRSGLAPGKGGTSTGTVREGGTKHLRIVAQNSGLDHDASGWVHVACEGFQVGRSGRLQAL